MSYYFEMSFIKARDKGEAYALCDRVARQLCEMPVASAHIRESLPYILDRFTAEDKECGIFRMYLESWTRTLFPVSAVYWPQYQLLGIPGEKPEEIMEGFSNAIPFQNSTDHDYRLDTWPEDIEFFQEIKRKVTSMSFETLSTEFGREIEESLREDKEYIDYMRRSLVYQLVYDRLDMARWLYGKDGKFQRFCMSGLTTPEKVNELYQMALAISKTMRW